MNRVVVPARQSTQASRIDSLELILGLLESIKIRALAVRSEKRRKMALSPLPSRVWLRPLAPDTPWRRRDWI